MRALGIAGVNVTVPHKVAVMEHLDEIDEEARLIGAVNTIVHRAGRLLGYNTDGRGLRSLERETGRTPGAPRDDLRPAGARRWPSPASLALAGAAPWVVNRTGKRPRRWQGASQPRLRPRALPLDERDPASGGRSATEIIIQTTSVGMYPHHDVPPVVPVEAIDPAALVCDIVYRPRETTLIRAPRERGCAVLTGEGMLAFQGAIAFELITGRRGARRVDARHLDAAFGAELRCESR